MSNNNSTRRVYTKVFKQEAVQLVQTSGKTMAAIERDLGLSKGILKQWVRQAAADGASAFPGHGRLKPEEEELRRLRRENEILRQERDLLKKVVSIFSQEPPRSTRS
jgi:transposase